MSGVLYLLPTTLSLKGAQTALDAVLPAQVAAIAAQLDYVVAENAKTARAFLKQAGAVRALQDIEIRVLDGPAPDETLDVLLAPIRDGRDGALISEAGCPAVADPGANLVRRAHERGVSVKPLVGPSSLLLALMGSGLNGQSFAFNGYLPVDAAQRTKRIRLLEERSRSESQTQLCIETPYRNGVLLAALLGALAPATRLAIASDLTLDSETIVSRSVAVWRADARAAENLAKRPSVFLFLA